MIIDVDETEGFPKCPLKNICHMQYDTSEVWSCNVVDREDSECPSYDGMHFQIPEWCPLLAEDVTVRIKPAEEEE